MKTVFNLMLVIVISTRIAFGQTEPGNETIRNYFEEIKANTEIYKELWNTDLYGPILLVNPKTMIVYANVPDSLGLLKEADQIYSGLLPGTVNIANTSINWNGKTWAMVMLPLPENKAARLDLLSHELFHRAQTDLGFKLNNPSNDHLDQKDGRIYLRLELEALRQALFSKQMPALKKNLISALYFRSKRHSIYPSSQVSENSLEINEGLAAYTGIFMSGRNSSQIIDYFDRRIADFQDYPSFVRSFAYLTTPLYGILLSRSDKYWNKRVGNDTDLTDFFINYFQLQIPDYLDKELINQYGFARISKKEIKREERRKQLITEYKLKFIEQPHLEIKFEKMSISFDPRNLMPIEGYGTYYPTIRVIDNWGILTVSNGALLGTNWDKITLSDPKMISKNRVTGNGWIIDLNNGYAVIKNSSDKNYSIIKQ